MDEQEYKKIIKNIEKEKKYVIKKGILFRRKKEQELQVIQRYELEGLMYMMHDHPLSAHFAEEATYEKIRERYYWKKMREDIKEYVKTCYQCQMRGKTVGQNELHPIKIKEPFHQIGIDFMGPLQTTKKGNKYIIVAVDYFTKWPEAKAVSEAVFQKLM